MMFNEETIRQHHYDAIGYSPEIAIHITKQQQAVYQRMAASVNAEVEKETKPLRELMLDIVAFLQMHPPGLTSPFQETPEPVREWLAERDDLVSRIRKMSEKQE
jgi:hypothetical protein